MSSAKAINIISNMRNIKTAVLSWYTDNLDRVNNKFEIYSNTKQAYQKAYNFWGDGSGGGYDEVKKYLSNEDSIKFAKWTGYGGGTRSSYVIEQTKNGTDWVVGYMLSNSEEKTIAGKLKSRASAVGLFAGDASPWNIKFDESGYYNGGNAVWMKILSLN